MVNENKLTFGSLFTGIGGFDLGFEQAGMECKWQVEIDDFCTKVLEKRWPNVKRYKDVREGTGRDLESVRVISGGFPCQDISRALRGSGAGLVGSQSGLWFEFQRIIREAVPEWIVIENVPALPRRRLFIVARLASVRGPAKILFEPNEIGTILPNNKERTGTFPMCVGWDGGLSYERLRQCVVTKADPARTGKSNGLSRSLDRHRYRALGNAVVPQVAKFIGERIVKVNENERNWKPKMSVLL
jgi:site-specific DNA-cytosine methylase